MSMATDIILITEIDQSDGIEGRFGLRRVDHRAGGDKAMQCDVLMSAMSLLTVEPGDIVEWFYAMDFRGEGFAQLLIKEEHEDVFAVHTRRPE